MKLNLTGARCVLIIAVSCLLVMSITNLSLAVPIKSVGGYCPSCKRWIKGQHNWGMCMAMKGSAKGLGKNVGLNQLTGAFGGIIAGAIINEILNSNAEKGLSEAERAAELERQRLEAERLQRELLNRIQKAAQLNKTSLENVRAMSKRLDGVFDIPQQTPRLKTIDPFGDFLFKDAAIRPLGDKLVTRHFDPEGLAARAEEWAKLLNLARANADAIWGNAQQVPPFRTIDPFGDFAARNMPIRPQGSNNPFNSGPESDLTGPQNPEPMNPEPANPGTDSGAGNAQPPKQAASRNTSAGGPTKTDLPSGENLKPGGTPTFGKGGGPGGSLDSGSTVDLRTAGSQTPRLPNSPGSAPAGRAGMNVPKSTSGNSAARSSFDSALSNDNSSKYLLDNLAKQGEARDWIGAGKIYTSRGDHQTAMTCFKFALEEDPRNVLANELYIKARERATRTYANAFQWIIGKIL